MAKRQNEPWNLEDILTQTQILMPETINAVKDSVTEKIWRRGEVIAAQGALCDKWIFISEGLTGVMFSRGKKNTTLLLGGSGEIFTSFKTLCNHKESVFRLETLTECKGWEMSHSKFDLLQKRYPELLIFERNVLRHQLYALEESYNQRGLLTAKERYEKFWIPREGKLLNFFPNTYSLKIPLKVIAQYLSMTPEMFSRIRRQTIEQKRKKQMDRES